MNRTLKLFSEFVSYKIRRPHHNGHGIHSPFLFDFAIQTLYNKTPLNPEIRKIKFLQNKLKESKEIILIEDFGAGSIKMREKERRISDIARYSSTSPKYGQLLYKIVRYLHPEVVIELGSCLGLGTMYMASAYENTKIYTIEGSLTLVKKAQKNYESLGFNNIFSVQGNFDDVLPVLLKENGKFDLIFIDGNHRRDSVINYLELCLPYAQHNSVIIFDDIRWSDDMEEAWREICGYEKVRLTLDLFRMGIVFFNDKIMKQDFELYY